MAFNHSNNTDARGSTINSTGRDQTNHRTTIIQINFSLFGSGPGSHLPVGFRDHLPLPISGADTLSLPERALITTNHSHESMSDVGTAVGVIVQITELLIGRGDASSNHRDLAVELKSLYQILTMTGLAVKEYEDRPLGQSLTNTIAPEVARCCTVLLGLLARVKGTWLGLNFTTIGNLWRPVWWAGWDGEDMGLLRQQLSESRKSLAGFLIASHSISWMELGNELHAGHVSLKQFHGLLIRHLPLLHIKLNAVHVVSHLGYIIPVPNMFCSSWKDFHYIINGYCKDRLGNRFIEHGEYKVMRADDSAIIGPSELASTAESGNFLEMCIVLRQPTADQKKCLRCGHMNLDVASNNGWIECEKCSGRFQVVTNDDESDTEIISPSNQPEGRPDADHEDPLQYDDGSIQFFRCIHLICINGVDLSQTEATRILEVDTATTEATDTRGVRWNENPIDPGLSPSSYSSPYTKGVKGPGIFMSPRAPQACTSCRVARRRCQESKYGLKCVRCEDRHLSCVFEPATPRISPVSLPPTTGNGPSESQAWPGLAQGWKPGPAHHYGPSNTSHYGY